MLHFLTHDLTSLLATYGYLAVFVFVAVESVGIPVPGETMLVAAALYAGSTHRLEIGLVVAAAALGAILGNVIGYTVGRIGGYPLLRRYGAAIGIDARRLRLGQFLFRRHGGKVVFFGRFVWILRTFAALLSGANLMGWRRFALFTLGGGVTWASLYGLSAYALGGQVGRLSTPFGVALVLVAAMAIVAFIIFVRRNEARLQAEADRSLDPDARASS